MVRYFAFVIFTMFLALVCAPHAHAVTAYSSFTCQGMPTTGDPSTQNTWGIILNTAVQISDAATMRVASSSVAGASNFVLTFSCGSLDQTDTAHFIFTGVLTGNINVLWPQNRARQFSVTNSTTGSFTLSLGANNGSSAPAGSVVTIAQGERGLFYSDGTNVGTRLTAGGVSVGANSVVGNSTSGTAQGSSLPIPTCTGGLTYSPGTGFGCNASGGGGGGGGTGLSFGGVQTTSFSAAANTIYCVDTTSGTLTMTLPSTPTVGNQIVFLDCASNFQTTNMTVANNSNLLMGFNANMTVNVSNAAATLIYASVANGWRMY